MRVTDHSRWSHRFVSESGDETDQDPRLGPLPSDWEFVPDEWTPNDPEYCVRYRNTKSGQTINYDPRMTAEALRKHTAIQEIILA